MCGIVGIAALRGAPAPGWGEIHAMCETILHRGPDDEGIHIQGGVGLGMRRLSIIDLSGGRQPMFNEDRTVRTVFNGEIYNYRELRQHLASRGHRFETSSDTEVIVHAYEEYGVNFPTHLNGMFAIALHDVRNRKLWLVRDHLGIKPLYYAVNGDYIVWGSELKTLLATDKLQPVLNTDALGQFLAWEYVPGAQTLLTGVHKLEPGHIFEIDLSKRLGQPHSYWDIPASYPEHALSDSEWEDVVAAKLHECVQRQLVSDVPLGAFLSGGVDSSLVVAAMGKAKTFSIGFTDPSYNELPYSRAVARRLGVEHTSEVITQELMHLFDRLMYFLDDPIGDFSIFPTYLVSQVARKHVTVALSGDGGDELFGGYETYLAEDTARFYRRLPLRLRQRLVEPILRSIKPRSVKKGLVNKAKRFAEGMHYTEALKHARWRLFLDESGREDLFTPEAYAAVETPVGNHILRLLDRAGERGALNRSLYVDVKSYLCDNCLTKLDRMSMAVSLEARVPFLDPELVELAFRVPESLKIGNGQTKILLKRVASRYVPLECIYRPKEGFSVPIKNWLRSQFRDLLESLLRRDRIDDAGLFRWEAVRRLKEEHLKGSANHSHVLWSLMVFEAWRDRWLKGSTASRTVTAVGASGHDKA